MKFVVSDNDLKTILSIRAIQPFKVKPLDAGIAAIAQRNRAIAIILELNCALQEGLNVGQLVVSPAHAMQLDDRVRTVFPNATTIKHPIFKGLILVRARRIIHYITGHQRIADPLNCGER